MSQNGGRLLEVESLEVQFFTRGGTAHAVRDVSLTTGGRRSASSGSPAPARA